MAPGATAYSITSSALPDWQGSLKHGKIKTRFVSGAPVANYLYSPQLNFEVDNGAAPVATITQAPTNGSAPQGTIGIEFDKRVWDFQLDDLTMTRDGGANRIPLASIAEVSMADPEGWTWNLAFIRDITMTSGDYVLTVNGSSSIKSVAGNVTATGDTMDWTQLDGEYQNGGPTEGVGGGPGLYYDVNADGFIVAEDSLDIINVLNTGGSGPASSWCSTHTCKPPYYDVNGDDFIVAEDALDVINYLNAGYNQQPPAMFQGGGPTIPPPDLKPSDVEATVQLQVTDNNGAPISSIKVGQQFQLRALLILTAPEGVEPFAGYADLAFNSALVSPVVSSNDIGLVGSTIATGLLDEVGRVVYGDASGLIVVKTFTATKKGTATFTADAADLFGHEIYVTGLNDALPLSQITFGSTTLTIKP